MRHSLVLLATLSCSAAWSGTALAAAAPSSGCAQVEAVGARGTTESPGFGSLLTPIADAIQSGAAQTVGLYPLPYPASFSPSYQASESMGVSYLESYLKSESASCLNQAFVLLGYSQGAQVVHDVLASGTLSSTVAARIVAVATFGDPRFNSAERFDAGTYTRGVNGELGARATGSEATYAGVIQSYCNGNDGVCQNGQSLYGHLNYQQTAAATAENYVLTMLRM